MKRLIVVFLLLLAVPVFAADTGTLTTFMEYPHRMGTNFQCLKLYWKTAVDGTKADVTIPVPTGFAKLLYVATDPGTTAPADNYDITLEDSEGLDVMGGGLVNRDTANVEYAQPLASAVAIPGGRHVAGSLTMKFTDTANADADGEVFLFFER